ncbi:MAG: hypothetical protein JWR16_1030, partial [Nevskia sp.]|nr:hypothetical protein [Nevskia sp.]
MSGPGPRRGITLLLSDLHLPITPS